MSSGVIVSVSIHAILLCLLMFSPQIKQLPVISDLIDQRTRADFSYLGDSSAEDSVSVAYIEPEKNAINKIKEKVSIPTRKRQKTPTKDAEPPAPKELSKIKTVLAKANINKEAATEKVEETKETETSKNISTKEKKETVSESLPPEKEELIANPDAPPEESFEDVAERNAGGANIDNIRDGRKLKQMSGNPKPSYPVRARLRKSEGTVVLRYEVTRDGSVSGIQVAESSGSSLLDDEAVEKVRQWKFQPGQEGETIHPVQFKLNGPSEKLRSRLRTTKKKTSL